MGLDEIKYVVEHDLCTRCGMCAAVCSSDVFEMGPDFLPRVVSDACSDCGLCSDYCSGQDVDFNQLPKISGVDGHQYNEVMGHYIECVVGHACDPELRKASSSGGLVTGVLGYLLAHNIVQRAVVAVEDPKRGWCFKPLIIDDPSKLLSTVGSKYSFTNTCTVFKELGGTDGKTAIVAIPCHVHAIRKYIADKPSMKDKFIIIGLACSSMLPPEATEFILQEKRVDKNSITEMRGKDLDSFTTEKIGTTEDCVINVGPL